MNPPKGQLIQVRLYNGVFFDAIVQEWSDDKSVLVLPDTNERVVIQKTLQDVLLFKLINISTSIKPTTDSEQVLNEYEALKQQPKTENDLSRMAELRDELNMLERENISGKLKSYMNQEAREITYGLPSNIQVSRAAQHTDQEAAPTSHEFNSGLQKLFRKKH